MAPCARELIVFNIHEEYGFYDATNQREIAVANYTRVRIPITRQNQTPPLNTGDVTQSCILFFKRRTFLCSPFCRLRRKVRIPKQEIYFFIYENLYPATETSNGNLYFKICWAQIIYIGTLELFSLWRQLQSYCFQRFLEITFRYYSQLSCWGLL